MEYSALEIDFSNLQKKKDTFFFVVKHLILLSVPILFLLFLKPVFQVIAISFLKRAIMSEK